jgi:hypothetical protein
MASELQIKANRKNALKSTGPRTEQGKEAVSQNAVKHGLCANKNVIKSESQEEYNQFRDDMISDLAPAGAMESMLAERIVSLSWRLKRAEHFQNMVIDSLMDYEMSANRYFLSKALKEAEAGNVELLMGHVINRDFSDSRTLDLLLMYERRIESSLYKATAELRKIQRLRRQENEIRDEDTAGVRHPEKEYRTLNTEYRIQDTEYRAQDTALRITTENGSIDTKDETGDKISHPSFVADSRNKAKLPEIESPC